MTMRQLKIWTAGGVAAGVLAFVAAMVLLDGGPANTSAAVPDKEQIAQAQKAPAPATAPASPTVDERFVVKTILPIDGPIKFGEWHWDEASASDGPVVVTVDLKANVLSIFRNGHEIGATAVLLGHDGKPTPVGVFPITQKSKDHVSNLYDAPMPYMLRLTNDGISIHGSNVENGYVTHGCIGVPEPFAKKLFSEVKLGDRVIVTDGAKLEQGQSIIG